MLIFLKSLAFLILVPGVVVIYAPVQIALATGAAPVLPWLRWAALPFWLAGAAGIVWCVWDFTFAGRGTPLPLDPPRELVVRGLYRCARNPMYTSAVLILGGHVVWFQTFWLLLYTVAVFLAFLGFVVGYEEPHLRRTFGDAYRRYCRSVPRWLPRLRPPTTAP